MFTVSPLCFLKCFITFSFDIFIIGCALPKFSSVFNNSLASVAFAFIPFSFKSAETVLVDNNSPCAKTSSFIF